MYQPRPIPFFNKALPENATTLLILALFCINVFYTLIGIQWELPLMLVFSDRTSLIFAANLPWLYILGAKNQPLRLLTGHSYEHLNVLHRRLGEWLCFVALLHASSMFVVWYYFFLPDGRSLHWFLTEKTISLGLLTLACYELLYATSLASFRKRSYELFLALHVALQAAALAFLYFHHRGSKPYVRVTLAIFLLDRLVFRLLTKSRSLKADLKILPDGQTLLLSANWPLLPPPSSNKKSPLPSLLPHTIHQGWAPAEHVFLTVPSLGRKDAFQAHPFTIASPAPHPQQDTHARLDLLLRARAGFTRSLLAHARSHASVSVRLDGPYGSSRALDVLRSSEVAVAVVGGSGIAVAGPLVWEVLRVAEGDVESGGSARPRRKVCLVWIVQRAEHVEWFGRERLKELEGKGLRVVMPEPTVRAGRPDVGGLVRGLVEELDGGGGGRGRRVGVVVSGPDGMNRAARNCCAELVREGRRVEVAVEKFGW